METKIVRPAVREDLERIMQIYSSARSFMEQQGNPTQWRGNYPPQALLEQDIAQGLLYVVEDVAGIHGVFYFYIGEDPTYVQIDGAWHSDRTYGTIHRIAGDGTGGVFRACLDFCRERIDYLRIDTHEDNLPMQRQLQRMGFQRCGIIWVFDGTPRIAFDWK